MGGQGRQNHFFINIGAKEWEMDIIEIIFYRNVENSNGDLYESPMGTYTFKGNMSEEKAISSAIEQLQNKHKVSSWQDIAHDYHVR